MIEGVLVLVWNNDNTFKNNNKININNILYSSSNNDIFISKGCISNNSIGYSISYEVVIVILVLKKSLTLLLAEGLLVLYYYFSVRLLI